MERRSHVTSGDRRSGEECSAIGGATVGAATTSGTTAGADYACVAGSQGPASYAGREGSTISKPSLGVPAGTKSNATEAWPPCDCGPARMLTRGTKDHLSSYKEQNDHSR